MTQKILVALDHSPFCQTVFDEAIKYTQAFQGELMLVHVLSAGQAGSSSSPAMPLMPFPEYYPGISASTVELLEKAWQEFENEGLSLLKQYINKAQDAGVEAEIRQVNGAPGPSICKAAKDWGATLIIMGRRGHKGLSELLIGSVSNHVLHHAPCSVLVINKPQ